MYQDDEKKRRQLLVEKNSLLDELLKLTHKRGEGPDSITRESMQINEKIKEIDRQLEELPRIPTREIERLRDIRNKITRIDYAALSPSESREYAKDVHDLSKTLQKITQPEEPTTLDRVRRALSGGDKTYQQLKDITHTSDQILRSILNSMIEKREVGWFGSQTIKGMTFTKDLDRVVVKSAPLKHFSKEEAEAIFHRKTKTTPGKNYHRRRRIGRN